MFVDWITAGDEEIRSEMDRSGAAFVSAAAKAGASMEPAGENVRRVRCGARAADRLQPAGAGRGGAPPSTTDVRLS